MLVVRVRPTSSPPPAERVERARHDPVAEEHPRAAVGPVEEIARMFAYPRYVIKGGEVVIEEGEIRKIVDGKGILAQPFYEQKVEDFIRPLFQQYYTMSFDNYPVEMERIEHPELIPCKQPGS